METTMDEAGVVVRQSAPTTLAWGSIIGGTIAALSTWILLYAFGLAVGLSAVDPANPGSLRGSGIFTGVWSLFVPLVALFIGGLVASRGRGAESRMDGLVHGLLVWGLTTLLGTWLVMALLSTVMSGVMGGAMGLGRAAVNAGESAIGQMAQSAQTGALTAADATGKIFWGVFGALFLGLLAAIGGALVGVARHHHLPRPLRRGDVSMPAGAHPVTR